MTRAGRLVLPLLFAGASLIFFFTSARAQTTEPAPSPMCTWMPEGYSMVAWDLPTITPHADLTIDQTRNTVTFTLDSTANSSRGWTMTTLPDQVSMIAEVWSLELPSGPTVLQFRADDGSGGSDLILPIAVDVSSAYTNAIMLDPVLPEFDPIYASFTMSFTGGFPFSNLMSFLWQGTGTAKIRVRLWAIVEGDYYNCADFAPLPFTPNCVITATQTIQTGPLVTETTQITQTYTVSSNLVANYSFEDGSLLPNSWVPVRDGEQLDTYPPFWIYSVSQSRSGFRSVYNGDRFELDQLLPLQGAGNYLVGAYGACLSADCSGQTASLYIGDDNTSSISPGSTTYVSFSGTHSTGGGAAWLRLAFNNGDTELVVDDVFAYPVDNNGDLICSAAYYPPPPIDGLNEDCIVDPLTGGCLVVPVGGAGSTCYYCQRPAGADASFIAYWIAWLGCIIRNLFSCSLRVWLLKVGNWTAGVVQLLSALVVWIPITAQGGADWLMGTAVAAITDAIAGIQPGGSTNIWDVLLAIIALILQLVSTIGGIMIGLLDLMLSLVSAVRVAFTVAPYQFHFGSAGITAPNTGDLAAAGYNDSKIFYILLLGMGFIDGVIGSIPDIQLALQFALGVSGLFLVIWTIRYWRRFVSL